ERIRRDPAEPAIGLLDALDFFDVGEGARILARGETAPDVRDLFDSDAPVQTSLPVDVCAERGEIRNAALELYHRHEIVVAEHVAPEQCGSAADVGPEA